MSTTFSGVRIVDMPDLGAVTADSSLVGEHAGSGRFSMPALTLYLADACNVKNYGAIGNGTTNDTAAFNAALAAASTAAKRVVLVPSGIYLIDPIVLPEGVTLTGDIPGPIDPRPGFLTNALGATLLVNSHATEFITLGSSSGLQDVLIYDPGQVAPTATAPNVFPAQVLMSSSSRVRRITLCNAYIGVRITVGRCRVESCYIGAYMFGVDVDNAHDVTYLDKVWVSTFYDTCLGLFHWQNMDLWVINNQTVAFRFAAADAVTMVDCGSFIRRIGIQLMDGATGASYGWCSNHNSDTCVYGIIASSTNQANGWQFSNFTALPTQAAPNAVTPISLVTGGASPPAIYWTGGANGLEGYWTNPDPLVATGFCAVRNVQGVQETQVILRNGHAVHFADVSNSIATSFVLGGDNNFVFTGSDDTGAVRVIAAMYQRSKTTPFNWLVPVVHGEQVTFNVGPVIPNTIFLEFFDTGGTPVTLGMQSDNTLGLYGTNAAGAPRPIMTMLQRSSASSLRFEAPVQFDSTVGFNAAPIARPTVTGSKGGNAALASLVTALTAYGLITDNTS